MMHAEKEPRLHGETHGPVPQISKFKNHVAKWHGWESTWLNSDSGKVNISVLMQSYVTKGEWMVVGRWGGSGVNATGSDALT